MHVVCIKQKQTTDIKDCNTIDENILFSYNFREIW